MAEVDLYRVVQDTESLSNEGQALLCRFENMLAIVRGMRDEYEAQVAQAFDEALAEAERTGAISPVKRTRSMSGGKSLPQTPSTDQVSTSVRVSPRSRRRISSLTVETHIGSSQLQAQAPPADSDVSPRSSGKLSVSPTSSSPRTSPSFTRRSTSQSAAARALRSSASAVPTVSQSAPVTPRQSEPSASSTSTIQRLGRRLSSIPDDDRIVVNADDFDFESTLV